MPPTTTRPKVTPAGQAAAGRIAEFRQNIAAGATAPEARRLVSTGRKVPTSITASDLSTPPPPVTTPPAPVMGSLPERANSMTNAVAKDVNGLITAQTEEAKRARELAQEMGALGNQGSLSDLFAQQRQDLGIDANLKELKDIQLRLAETDTNSELTKTRIEGAAGQTLAQGQREVTQQDRENAVLRAGDAARAAVLQGNIDTATQLARETVNMAFQDRQLKAQNVLNQLNYYQGVADKQTAQLLEQDKRAYEAELARIEELKTNIASAMVSGATSSEIAQLNSANLDDASKLALAQQITARGATEMRNLEIAQKNASINASNASAANSVTDRVLKLAEKGDPNAIAQLGFDPRTSTGNFEAESALRKEFNALEPVKQANAVQSSLNQINSAYIQALQSTNDGTSKAAADQALIISFNKMLDPGSVVREGEFARSTEGQSLINQWKAKAEQVSQGGAGLTDEERASIVNLTRTLYADYVTTHNDKAFEFRQNAVRQGGDPNYVAGYLDTVGITAQDAADGAIIIKNGIPYQKQGDKMVQLDI